MPAPVSRYALRGRVVTMDPARPLIANGVVYVDGDTIAGVGAVGEEPPALFAGITPIATNGTIYPGLMDLHNHLAYDALPLFRVPKRYDNRDQWRGTKATQRYVSGPAGVIARVDGAIQAAVRYVECKCLVGGVTTSQGITLRAEAIRKYFRGVVRNAELPDDERLPAARPKVGDVDEGGAKAFRKTLNGDGARLLHLSEGIDDKARGYFERLRLPDGDPDGLWAINERFVGIHATALKPGRLSALAARKGSIVWSPFSNLALYGATTDIATARQKKIRVAIGSDWSPSGTKNLLGELKVARVYAALEGIALDDRALVEMVTVNPASILGWDELLGSITKDKLADLLVVAGDGGDEYAHLVEATESAVALVVIGGRARYGRPSMVGRLGPITDTATVAGVKRAFSLDVVDPVLGDVRLRDATRTLTQTLGNLVDLADGLGDEALGVTAASAVEGAAGDERWFLELDVDLPDPFVTAPVTGDAYGDIAVNLKLDPLAMEGDAAFFAQLANLTNVPAPILDALPRFYGEQPRQPSPITPGTADDADEIELVDVLAPLELSTLTSLPPQLGIEDRLLLVDQAIVLLEEVYVHLPLKRSMHAVDPVQRLRLLRHRLAELTAERLKPDISFHSELAAVFTSLRDLHTHYVLPEPFRSHYAYLPFLVEECWDGERSAILVTKLARGFNLAPFAPGVEVIHWNGVPVRRAIEIHADGQSGSNRDARLARGMDALVIRALGRMAPPDEEWATVTYRTEDGQARELRQRWLTRRPDEPSPFADDDEAGGAGTLGLDAQTEAVNRARRDLYRSRGPDRTGSPRRGAGRAASGAAPDEVETTMVNVFRARRRKTIAGLLGHLRIFTFMVPDPSEFVDEFVRLVEELPPRGLIIDVRGNGGGDITAAERLLQVLTPRQVEPAPAQFITSPLVQALCRANAPSVLLPGLDLGEWIPSIAQAVETGATYSLGFPITARKDANDRGQRYHGPVVLITDARCYSATDIFAAGFRDHDIGPILGTAGNTGAGGANVWTHGMVRRLLDQGDSGALRPLVGGASFRVAIRRTTRVGSSAGAVLEDLGVVPNDTHRLTTGDVLCDNVDLVDAAARLLGESRPRRLEAKLTRVAAGLRVRVKTRNLDRVDAFVDRRPVGSRDIRRNACSFTVDAPLAAGDRLELEGYEGGVLVAARRYPLDGNH